MDFTHEDLLRYFGRDSGCLTDAVDVLRPKQRSHHRALVIFDRVGSGGEANSAETLETEMENSLRTSGWPEGHAIAVVIDPELEAWVWSDSPHVPRVLGWRNGSQPLRQYLADQGLWGNDQHKPSDPKTAMEQAVRKANQPLVAGLFSELAATVSVQRCKDRAFNKFVQTLRRWFPATDISTHTVLDQ